MIDARAKIAIGGTLNAIYGRDMDFLAIRYVGALYLFLYRFVVERELFGRHVCTPLCWCCCIPISALIKARNGWSSPTKHWRFPKVFELCGARGRRVRQR